MGSLASGRPLLFVGLILILFRQPIVDGAGWVLLALGAILAVAKAAIGPGPGRASR